MTRLSLKAESQLSLPSHFLADKPSFQNLILDLSCFRPCLTDQLALPPGLESLALKFQNFLPSLPPGLLDHVPNLRSLSLEVEGFCLAMICDEPLPRNMLAHAPHLKSLKIAVPDQVSPLPEDFLTHPLPQLATATLQLAGGSTDIPWLLPADFLVQAPRLTHLDLVSGFLEALPPNFLAVNSHLVQLRLQLSRLTALPDTFLAQDPHLSEVELRLSQLVCPTRSDFLASMPPV